MPASASNERDEFGPATKRELAARVGYRCSKPGCERETVGPADDLQQGFTHTGDAAHITAAARGGPRWDSTLTRDARRSAENGIWLCLVHARLVDANRSQHTVDLLREWKRRAEHRAARRQELSTVSDARFITHQLTLAWHEGGDDSAVKQAIQDFFDDVASGEVMRDADRQWSAALVYELARNARQHEGVRWMTLASYERSIELRYASSSRYGLDRLLGETSGRGGFDAVRDLEEVTEGRVHVVDRLDGATSRFILTAPALGVADHPCAIDLSSSSREALLEFVRETSCAVVHVHGDRFASLSDNYDTVACVKALLEGGHRVVVHARHGPVAQHLRDKIITAVGSDAPVTVVQHELG